MAPFFSYSPKTTSISYPWPDGVTGLERVALSAQGDLQRVLSAFFARPITVSLVYSHTYYHPRPDSPAVPLTLPNPNAIMSVSPEAPIFQDRQVRLMCAGKVVCVATSQVRIASPQCAHLFLEEKYAIGQLFNRLERIPAFELLAVGVGPERTDVAGKLLPRQLQEQLWRKYKLSVDNFECEILEVFPSRDMFTIGEAWLDGHGLGNDQTTIKEANYLPGFLGTATSAHVSTLHRRLLIPSLFFFLTLQFSLLFFFRNRDC